MIQEVKNKLDLLTDFCKANNIQLEVMSSGSDSDCIDLNILNENGDLIQYDSIGRGVNV